MIFSEILNLTTDEEKPSHKHYSVCEQHVAYEPQWIL